MNYKNKTWVISGFCIFFIGLFIWYSRPAKMNEAVELLAGAHKLEKECPSKESFDFPIEPFDGAVADPDCVKNTVEFAQLLRFDLEKLSPEKNCKCIKLNLDNVLKKFGTTDDQCKLIQATNIVKKRCKELAGK